MLSMVSNMYTKYMVFLLLVCRRRWSGEYSWGEFKLKQLDMGMVHFIHIFIPSI